MGEEPEQSRENTRPSRKARSIKTGTETKSSPLEGNHRSEFVMKSMAETEGGLDRICNSKPTKGHKEANSEKSTEA